MKLARILLFLPFALLVGCASSPVAKPGNRNAQVNPADVHQVSDLERPPAPIHRQSPVYPSETVTLWRFVPKVKQGAPVRSKLTIPFTFGAPDAQ